MVCAAGPAYVRAKLQELLVLWHSMFPRSRQELNLEISKGSSFSWVSTLETRAGALACEFLPPWCLLFTFFSYPSVSFHSLCPFHLLSWLCVHLSPCDSSLWISFVMLCTPLAGSHQENYASTRLCFGHERWVCSVREREREGVTETNRKT